METRHSLRSSEASVESVEMKASSKENLATLSTNRRA